MSKLVEKIKVFTVYLLMLQILNLSVYNSDFYSFVFNEQAEVAQENPIDSFAELIFEDFAGMGDVFPEHSQQSSKSPLLKQNLSLKLIAINFFPHIEIETLPSFSFKKKYYLSTENYSFLFVNEISHPPSCEVV